ncbi:MAG TPA: hydrogenase iron-sulfur subunit [Myxococcota bacterium]|nr:hydrogenase iron-sulfur subunit [Myxococcota bacterium]HRY95808.1 hydrogenase iron-sulfur subunit [Myxococcota bacterium]HSA22760.1 hydrogenase iron-sulfur subunit [Myxococcota bacterium]
MDSVCHIEGFEPRLLGILCHWCSYTGADQAGAAKLPCPPNLRIARVMCSGRVEPELILRAFLQGADGVLVCGCHPGDCHYLGGNCKAALRVGLLRRVLAQLGIAPGRLRLEWVSASEGERFSRVAQEAVDAMRALGPLGLGGGQVAP